MEGSRTWWDKNIPSIRARWTTDNKFSTLRNYATVNSFIRKIPSYSTFLDVGSGWGGIPKHCRIAPEKYLGIDFSIEMVRLARDLFPRYRFEHHSFQEYVPPVEGFDVVVSKDFLGHQRDYFECLDKMILMTNKLLVIDANVSSKSVNIETPKGWWDRQLSVGEFERLKEILTSRFREFELSKSKKSPHFEGYIGCYK